MDYVSIGLAIMSVLLLWNRHQHAWKVALLVFVLVITVLQIITWPAIISILMLSLVLFGYQANYNEVMRWSCLILSISIGLLLGLHIWPGFNNIEFVDSVRLSNDSAQFDVWFNFDKIIFGILVVGCVYKKQLLESWQDVEKILSKFLAVIVIGLPLVFGLGMMMGYSQFDPKWNAVFWPWAIKNLFFTVIAEEALFRGLIQNQLTDTFGRFRATRQKASIIAISIAALLFGVAHFGGGFSYVILATVAGMVYGYAFYVTGRIEAAILSHFLLNVCHFLFFSYPYLNN